MKPSIQLRQAESTEPVSGEVGLCHAEAVSSLGESLAETALMVRAGLDAVGPSDFIDASGQRVMACACPALSADLPATERLLAMASHALHGVARRLEAAGDGSPERAPVILLCLASRFAEADHPDALTPAGQWLVAELRRRLPSGWQAADIEVFPFGRAAGALAMKRALQLADGPRDVIWGGVDTLLDWAVLEPLLASDRLMTLDNVDGIRPGEAAAFAVVTPRHRGQARVLGLGLGRERHPVLAAAPSQSEGMTQALDTALAPMRAAERRSNLWLTDASHERYATQELQRVIARFGDVLGTHTDLQTPLKELGDVGAAAMPLLAGLAAQSWLHGVQDEPLAVLLGSSDEGARGAMLLGTSLVASAPPTGHVMRAPSPGKDAP